MKIAILSSKRTLYSTRRLCDAGRKRKHDMRVVHPLTCLFSSSMDELVIRCDGLALHDFDCVIPRIGASITQHGTALLNHFELRGVRVINSAASIALSRDKLRCMQHLAAANVPIPNTVMVRSAAGISEALEIAKGTPVILKLLSGTQGIGVIKADTIDNARSTLEALWSLGEDILIQEYIAESKGSDTRAIVVDGRVVAAMHRSASYADEFRSNLHRGGSSEPADLTDEVRDTAIRATRAMGLDVAGVDMLMSARGPLVIEVNSSPGLEGIETTTGRDVAKEIIRSIERG